MEVFIFDTKRNASVLRGRREKERATKKQQESIVDLELDYLAPYLERYPDVDSITKAQALEVSAHLQEGPIGFDPKKSADQGQVTWLRFRVLMLSIHPIHLCFSHLLQSVHLIWISKE